MMRHTDEKIAKPGRTHYPARPMRHHLPRFSGFNRRTLKCHDEAYLDSCGATLLIHEQKGLAHEMCVLVVRANIEVNGKLVTAIYSLALWFSYGWFAALQYRAMERKGEIQGLEMR